jgi:hypothetical protein
MLTLSKSSTLSASRPAINLSTGAGNLTASIGVPYQDTTSNECYGNLCAEMGIPCQCDDFSTEPLKALNQQLLAITHHLSHPKPIVTTFGNDKGKDDDGQKDGPHHDITNQSSGDDCYCNEYYGVKCGNCA